MLDLNQYDYAVKSFTKSNKYHILPLTENGLNTYYSRDSHCHNFMVNRMREDLHDKDYIREHNLLESVPLELAKDKNYSEIKKMILNHKLKHMKESNEVNGEAEAKSRKTNEDVEENKLQDLPFHKRANSTMNILKQNPNNLQLTNKTDFYKTLNVNNKCKENIPFNNHNKFVTGDRIRMKRTFSQEMDLRKEKEAKNRKVFYNSRAESERNLAILKEIENKIKTKDYSQSKKFNCFYHDKGTKYDGFDMYHLPVEGVFPGSKKEGFEKNYQKMMRSVERGGTDPNNENCFNKYAFARTVKTENKVKLNAFCSSENQKIKDILTGKRIYTKQERKEVEPDIIKPEKKDPELRDTDTPPMQKFNTIRRNLTKRNQVGGLFQH